MSAEAPTPSRPWWLAADHLLMLAFLLPYLVLRCMQAATTTQMSVDGGYYVDVAKHVRDGLGLQTNISVFHFGYPSFPHPSSVYPLWPTLLGTVAKLAPLEAAAHWLPAVLSAVAVGLMYLWGRRTWPEPLLPAIIPGLNAGHAFAVGLAVHREWVVFTVLPYTEALAWTLLAGFMLRAATVGGSARWQWGVESGAWIVLLYMTRSQFLVVHLAVVGAQALRVIMGPDRRRAAAQLLLSQTIALGALAAWFAYLKSFLYAPSLSALLRFDQHRVSPLLPELEVIVSPGGPWATLGDRLWGLRLAFDDLNAEGYETAYHALHWALPMAGCLWLAQLWGRRREPLWGRLQALRGDPRFFYWALTIALAAGGLLSVHLVHKNFNGEWYFARRQGLMSLPAFVLALGWMMRQPGNFGKGVGSAILITNLWIGVHDVANQGLYPMGVHKGTEPYQQLVTWLRAQEKREGPLVVAMDDDASKRIVYRTDHIGYHWIEARTSFQDLLKITDTLGARYVILRQDPSEWRVMTDDPKAFAEHFEALAVRPNRLHIYKRRVARHENRE